MESFSRHDFRAALDFIALLGEARDLDEFASHIAFKFDGVVACHCSSYNEINPRRRRAHWIANVETGPADVQAFEQHIAENPLINHVTAHPLGPAVRISDLVSQRQWRSLGVYSDFYHPWNCERIMSLELATGAVSISVAAFRDGRDFSERDRAMMTVLRPHLIGAYRHAALTDDLGERLALLDRGIEIGGLGVIVIGADGRVRSMSDAARVWLAAYFGPMPDHDCLPDAVAAWLRRGENPASAAETMPEAPLPFVVARDDARLVLRCLRHAGQTLILSARSARRSRPRIWRRWVWRGARPKSSPGSRSARPTPRSPPFSRSRRARSATPWNGSTGNSASKAAWPHRCVRSASCAGRTSP